MATAYQIEFVENVEKSIRSLFHQSRTPPSISAVMEDAGYESGGLFAIVSRLKEAGEGELLSRLRAVFDKTKKLPACLEDIEPSELSLKREHYPPKDVPPLRARKPPVNPPEVEDAVDGTLIEVLRLLRPLSGDNRITVISTAMRRYGVGE